MRTSDERLDEALRRAEPMLPDDGFTASVLARLPRRRVRKVNPRSLTLAVAAGIGSVSTALLAPPVERAFNLYTLSGGLPTSTLTIIVFVALVAAPLAWVVRRM